MPGQIGTEIVAQFAQDFGSGSESDEMDAPELAQARKRMAGLGVDGDSLTDEQIRATVAEQARRFRDDAPTSAAQAPEIILDGVKA